MGHGFVSVWETFAAASAADIVTRQIFRLNISLSIFFLLHLSRFFRELRRLFCLIQSAPVSLLLLFSPPSLLLYIYKYILNKMLLKKKKGKIVRA